MLQPKLKRSRDRQELKMPTPVRIVSAVKNAAVLTVTYDQPVVLKGTPKYTTNLAGITALSATSPSPAVVQITFSATIATAVTLNIPVVDPAIRNKVGGFVADTTFPIT
ncbi:MAG: hypothetical protein L0219_06265 [Phycisphaerales bacterium]|nr:hypothetical protein [Phycisphaerales bacterium]